MTLSTSVRFAVVLGACLATATGCSRNSPTVPWPPNTNPVVFRDNFGAHVGWQAFGNSKLDALSVDTAEKHSGTTSLKFTVPAPGDPSGGYAGGALVASQPRSFAPYNALSFWVKASRNVSLETVGLGNDNTGTSLYEAKSSAIPMTTAWSHVLIPIPSPAKLGVERGMFFIAEGPQGGTGLTFWVDDIEYVHDASITDVRPAVTTQTVTTVVGTTLNLAGTARTLFKVGGMDQVVSHSPNYFTFSSTDATVATITDGNVAVVGAGTATLTAKLDGIDATGSITVSALLPPPGAAPTPTLPAASVISLYSDAYPNVLVDSWRQVGSPAAQYQDLTIAGNATKVYTGLASGFVGIQFANPTVDANTMTHFHMDIWVPTGSTFRVKLVDFGPDGVFTAPPGSDDTQHELTFNAGSAPPLATGAWVGLEIPLASFTALANPARHLAQLILSGDAPTVFVDNIYLHK